MWSSCIRSVSLVLQLANCNSWKGFYIECSPFLGLWIKMLPRGLSWLLKIYFAKRHVSLHQVGFDLLRWAMQTGGRARKAKYWRPRTQTYVSLPLPTQRPRNRAKRLFIKATVQRREQTSWKQDLIRHLPSLLPCFSVLPETQMPVRTWGQKFDRRSPTSRTFHILPILSYRRANISVSYWLNSTHDSARECGASSPSPPRLNCPLRLLRHARRYKIWHRDLCLTSQ